ncbi:PEP-CTERM/exosortase system-associated acyltransferase [Salinicola sp. CPA57]|uniref:PEP-CTERM/exosortase system-associated acyltransferase n=1 Tax=Salinicola sp. CPA57 TaxID=1949080 RepID=UPI00130029FF|nr:PEP-CTERM/exosortase system-associated acyltransferase [Salinicola sp. CPA57]
MSLYDQFHQQFEFVLATSESEKQYVYRLRYQVYTQEFGHSMPGEPARQLEYDEFDQSALHCFIRHRATQEPVACIRVIYPSSVRSELPIESNSRGEFSHAELNPDALPRNLICEVSRAAILGRYRKRQSGAEKEWSGYPATDNDYKVSSLLGISVYLASTVMIGLMERRHALALMEPRLARLLSRFGLAFLQVGNIQQFNGVRAAYYIDQHQAEGDLKPELKAFYSDIIHSLSIQFNETLKKPFQDRFFMLECAGS